MEAHQHKEDVEFKLLESTVRTSRYITVGCLDDLYDEDAPENLYLRSFLINLEKLHSTWEESDKMKSAFKYRLYNYGELDEELNHIP